MILKHLFHQYDTGQPKPCFASRLMKALGNRLMGTPAEKGLGHIMDELQNNYYYTQADRRLPREKKKLQQWQMDSIQVSEYRQVEAPQIALATSIAVFAGSFVLVAAASLFNGSLKETVGLGEGGALTNLFSDDDLAITYDDCVKLEARMVAEKLTPDQIPNFAHKRQQCIQASAAHEAALMNKETK